MLGSVMDRISQPLLVDRLAIFVENAMQPGQMRIARSMGVRLSESLDLSFLEPARPEFARGALFFESPRAARDFSDSVRRTLEQLDLNYFVPCRIREHTVAVLADTARNKIIEVQLLKRAANGVTEVSCRTGRLKKECPAGKLGPGRLEETKIQGFGKPHTHGARNAHLPWFHGVLDENSQTADPPPLQNPLHDLTHP